MHAEQYRRIARPLIQVMYAQLGPVLCLHDMIVRRKGIVLQPVETRLRCP